MQISSIAPFSSAAPILNPAPVTLLPSDSSPSAASLPPLSQSSGLSFRSAAASAMDLDHGIEPRTNLQSQPSQAQDAADSDAEGLLVSGYSTKVNGTQYSGVVDESGTRYVAVVPGLVGATATGTTVGVAENNLGFRIDELV